MYKSLLFIAAPLAVLAKDISVEVGNNQGALRMFPESVTAAVGDRIIFSFYPYEHSVVSGDFSKGCQPSDENAKGFFYSGFWPSASGANATAFIYTVDTTDPIYYYCSYMKHCQGGMVGSINAPTSGNTIAKYASNAASASNNVTPDGKPRGGKLVALSSVNSGSSSTAGSSSGVTATTLTGTRTTTSAGMTSVITGTTTRTGGTNAASGPSKTSSTAAATSTKPAGNGAGREGINYGLGGVVGALMALFVV